LYATFDELKNRTKVASAQNEIAWFRNLGLRTILQYIPEFQTFRPIDLTGYQAAGQILGLAFKDGVEAIGNWGIEQSNHRTQQNPGYRPFQDGQAMTDLEYDNIASAIYNGIKATAPILPVLIGNLATELPDVRPDQYPGSTITRMYGLPVNGKFDGVILNTYWGEIEMMQNSLSIFDTHKETQKDIWQEENMEQISPSKGPNRRYQEWTGASNLVRSRITMASQFSGHVGAITMWDLVGDNDWNMVNSAYQPRPQFVAQAVMADSLANAVYVENKSTDKVSVYKWERGDGPIWIAWANSDTQSLDLQVPPGNLVQMDLMGNRAVLPFVGDHVKISLTTTPVYVFSTTPKP
jgi:hypothetical protein